MRSSKTPIRTVACVVGLGLMFVQAALAADKQPIRFNAADQAAAKARAGEGQRPWHRLEGRREEARSDTRRPLHVQALGPRAHRRRQVRVQDARGAITSSRTSSRRRRWSPPIGAAVENTSFMACARNVVMNTDDANVKFVSFNEGRVPEARAVRHPVSHSSPTTARAGTPCVSSWTSSCSVKAGARSRSSSRGRTQTGPRGCRRAHWRSSWSGGSPPEGRISAPRQPRSA